MGACFSPYKMIYTGKKGHNNHNHPEEALLTFNLRSRYLRMRVKYIHMYLTRRTTLILAKNHQTKSINRRKGSIGMFRHTNLHFHSQRIHKVFISTLKMIKSTQANSNTKSKNVDKNRYT